MPPRSRSVLATSSNLLRIVDTERTVCITGPSLMSSAFGLAWTARRHGDRRKARPLRPLGDARGPRPEHVDDPGCDGGLAEPLARLVFTSQGFVAGDELEAGGAEEIEVVVMGPQDVDDRARAHHVLHHDAHEVAARGRAVLGEGGRAEGHPLVPVDVGPRAQEDDPAIRGEEIPQAAEEASAPHDVGNVVERERREDEVDAARREGAQVPVADEEVPSARVGAPGELDHARRDVDAGDVEAKAREEPRGAARAAAEVESFLPADVLLDDRGEVPKG